jgi:hypothetical protein
VPFVGSVYRWYDGDDNGGFLADGGGLMKDKATGELANDLETGVYDNTQFRNLSNVQKEMIIASLRFASERVGIEVTP